jgi:hypothetical protein
MKPDGSGERILTSGYHNEGPTFAPNGRVVMFFREAGGGPSLYTVDISGRNEQKVPTPGLRVRSGLVAIAIVNETLKPDGIAATAAIFPLDDFAGRFHL